MESTRVIEMLQNAYNGAAWHGLSIMEILNKISAKQAFQSSTHIHNIGELVQHMIAWRIFAAKHLEGDDNYEVSQDENWKTFNKQDDSAWIRILTELEDSQQKLVKVLENFPDDKFSEEVPGKAYTYYTLAHGVIQHDLYHLGEIALLAREFK